MAEDVLGITGIVNIDDIKKTFDALISDLDRLGAETDVISARMSKALTDIANSSEKDLAAKTKAAMQVLNDAIAQTNKQLTTTPEMLKNAEQEATRLQQAISKLEKQQGQTIVGSKEFDELKQQLDSQREAYSQQVQKIDEMRAAQQGAADSVSQLNSIYINFLSSLQQQNETEREAVDATAAETQATREQTEAKREDNEATKQATQYNAEFVKGLEDIAARATEMGTKLGGTAKVLSGSIAQNASFVRSHLEYIEKQKKTLEKALKSGDKEQAAWAEREIKQAEQRVQQAADSIQSFMQTIEAISSNAVPLPEESATSKGPRQQLMELRNEITMLTLQWREMTEAERASAEGQELKQKLDELSAKAAKLQDAFGDVQEQIKNDANDTAAFAAVTQGLNLLISGFGAAEGAAAALGMSEEELARAQTIIQGSLAATNFLTEAGNALQGQSALMRGISTIQTLAAAKATDIETAAKGRNVVVTKAAAVAQGIFNAIAKANPYVLLAMAIVTVVGALAAFALGSSKASKAEEEHQKELERTKEIAQEAYGVFNSEIAKTLTSYQRLQTQWRKLSSEQDKQKWIKKNAQEFKTLGVRIDNTSEAERFLVNNTSKVIEALSLRAQAAAYAAKAQKEYEKALSGVTDNYTAGDTISMSDARELFGNNWTMYGTVKKDSTLGMDWMAEDDFVLNQRGVDLLIERAMGPAQQRAEMWLQTAEDLKAQAESIYDSIGVRTVDEDEPTTTDKPTKDKPKYKSAAELNDELLKLTKERIDRELEAEKEGTKRWEQLQRERIAMQAEIDRRAAQKAGDEAVANLDASYKGGKSGLNEQQYNERRAQLQQQTSQLLAAISAKEQQDLADLSATRIKAEQQQEDELVAQYQSYIDKKKKIDADYQKALQDIDKAIAQAQERGDTERVEALQRSRAQATKQHNEQQAGLSLQQLKATPDYVRAFEDLGNTSSQTLQALIQQFEEAKQAAAQSLDPEKLREYTSTLQQMYDELESRDPFAALTTSAQELTNAENRLRLATANVAAAKERVRLAKAAGDAKQLAKANEQLTQAEEKEREATDAVEKSKNRYRKAQKAVIAQVDELANAISNLGNAIGGEAGQILGLIGDVMTFTTQTIDGIKAVTAAGVQALSTLEKASVILAIISAAIQLIQKISSLYKDAHAQYEEFAEKQKEINELRSAVDDYRLAVIEAQNAEKRWFASTGMQDLRDMYEYSNKALESYINKMYEAQAIYQNESGGGWLTNALAWIGGLVSDIVSIPGKLIVGALDKVGILDKDTVLGKIMDWGITGLFGGAEGLIGKGVGALLDSMNYQEGTTAAFKNLRIETRSASSGFLGTGIGGHSQRTEDLTEWAKKNLGADLFDNSGFVNVELANTILDKYGDKLVGETKATLEELVRLKQEYDKFREQLEEYVSDMFSPLTDDMTDALWDWLKDGKDVLDSFKQYASDTFAEIAKEMIKQALLQRVFDGFQDKLANLYEAYSMGAMDEKALTDGIMKATDALLSNAESQLPTIQNLLTYIDEKFKERGFDITGSDAFEQEASSKAWQTMSQDTAEELNGRFTALYECGLQILDFNAQTHELLVLVQADIQQTRLATVTLSQNMTELLDVQYDNLNKLDEIIANTAPLPDMATVIEKIYNAVKNVNKK